MALAIRTADCIPILFAAPAGGAIAAAHAGWRGLLAGVVLETIHCLQRQGGSRPQEIRCALGPAIGPCCYEFPRGLFSHFLDCYGERCRPAWCDKSGRGYLDLRRLAMVQLAGAGLRSENISTVGGCTCCEVKSFHSYRRDGAKAGRQISFILLKP